MTETRTVRQQYIIQSAKKSFLSDQCQPDAKNDTEMGIVVQRALDELTADTKTLTASCKDLCESVMNQPEWEDCCDLCCECFVFLFFYSDIFSLQ